MSIWDNNGYGQNNEGSVGDGFAHDDAGDAFAVQNGETDVPEENVEADVESNVGDDAKDKSGRQKRSGGKVPKLDETSAKKLLDAANVLNGENGKRLCKALLGSSSNSPATLLSQLTEKRNRDAVAATAARIRSIKSDDPVETRVNAAMEFTEDKDLSKTLIALLSAVAPDAGFERATGNAKSDARNVAEHWTDGVDLSAIDKLCL